MIELNELIDRRMATKNNLNRLLIHITQWFAVWLLQPTTVATSTEFTVRPVVGFIFVSEALSESIVLF